MGGCGSTSSDNESSNNRKNKTITSNQINQNTEKNKNSKKSKNDDEFKDKPEIPGINQYFGEGLRKVKAYHNDWAFDVLTEKRNKFWSTRKHNRRVWAALKECCEAEHHETAAELLMIAELVCIGDNMQHVQDLITNEEFHLPNWVITDPEMVIDYAKKIRDSEKEPSVRMRIVINNSLNVEIHNKMKGAEIKEAYMNSQNCDPSKKRVRMFYAGKEILDEHMMLVYDIKDGSNVIGMICDKVVD